MLFKLNPLAKRIMQLAHSHTATSILRNE
jgi:hypothetical protein